MDILFFCSHAYPFCFPVSMKCDKIEQKRPSRRASKITLPTRVSAVAPVGNIVPSEARGRMKGK